MEGVQMVRKLQETKKTLDDGFNASSGISLFAGGPVMNTTSTEAPRVSDFILIWVGLIGFSVEYDDDCGIPILQIYDVII